VQKKKNPEKTTSSLHMHIGPPLWKILSKYSVVEAREIAAFLHNTPYDVSIIIYGQTEGHRECQVAVQGQ
jgi:hypothetical protein